MSNKIKNVFVLMLENRSFDSMLGFSSITGVDPVTGGATAIDGLSGTESNLYQGVVYTVSTPGDQSLPVDPGHEFPDVLTQLCGVGAVYGPGGNYPPIDNSGFVHDYAVSPSREEGNAPGDFGAILRGYSPGQLPVLNALAREFAVCDRWHSSLPGPTWPNRLFAHAASSSGLDTSPTTEQMIEWDLGSGLTFPNGTIFDALEKNPALKDRAWRVFSGAGIGTISSALKGISKFSIRDIADFVRQVQSPEYSWAYTFIEPSYGDFENGTFVGGSSQHPMDNVTNGEALIKQIYEAIRRSPHWMNSLLVVTWDEHGGFFDHVAPPAAVAPGDTTPSTGLNKYGFTFERYGVRVPAVIVSPWIPKNIVDHRLYDHASIPATLEKLFGLQPLTRRDAQANDLTPLLFLAGARADTPVELPSPAQFGNVAQTPAPSAPDPNGPIPASQRGFLHLAMKHDIELSSPGAQPGIQARVAAMRTLAEARDYIAEVKQKSRAATGDRQ